MRPKLLHAGICNTMSDRNRKSTTTISHRTLRKRNMWQMLLLT